MSIVDEIFDTYPAKDDKRTDILTKEEPHAKRLKLLENILNQTMGDIIEENPAESTMEVVAGGTPVSQSLSTPDSVSGSSPVVAIPNPGFPVTMRRQLLDCFIKGARKQVVEDPLPRLMYAVGQMIAAYSGLSTEVLNLRRQVKDFQTQEGKLQDLQKEVEVFKSKEIELERLLHQEKELMEEREKRWQSERETLRKRQEEEKVFLEGKLAAMENERQTEKESLEKACDDAVALNKKDMSEWEMVKKNLEKNTAIMGRIVENDEVKADLKKILSNFDVLMKKIDTLGKGEQYTKQDGGGASKVTSSAGQGQDAAAMDQGAHELVVQPGDAASSGLGIKAAWTLCQLMEHSKNITRKSKEVRR